MYVWTPVFGIAAIQDGADIGMVQRRQDLPFHPKPLNESWRFALPANHFDGYELKIMIIRPGR
jgi:hypothetical protein